jgi:alkylation response protein AidB-like acyl-CoA dehydrogenase
MPHARWLQIYDHRDIPIGDKDGITLGMSMTERQGGSDVRANTTVATPVAADAVGPGQAYLLNGHKWFTSAPMVGIDCDVGPSVQPAVHATLATC